VQFSECQGKRFNKCFPACFPRFSDLQAIAGNCIKNAVYWVTEGGVPISEAAERFLASRSGMSLSHRKNTATRISYLTRFLEGRTTASVTVDDIQRLLDGLNRGDVTKDNYKRCIVSFFTFCLERKWCGSNPAAATSQIKTAARDVEILSPCDSASLLAHSAPAILPGVVSTVSDEWRSRSRSPSEGFGRSILMMNPDMRSLMAACSFL